MKTYIALAKDYRKMIEQLVSLNTVSSRLQGRTSMHKLILKKRIWKKMSRMMPVVNSKTRSKLKRGI